MLFFEDPCCGLSSTSAGASIAMGQGDVPRGTITSVRLLFEEPSQVELSLFHSWQSHKFSYQFSSVTSSPRTLSGLCPWTPLAEPRPSAMSPNHGALETDRRLSFQLYSNYFLLCYRAGFWRYFERQYFSVSHFYLTSRVRCIVNKYELNTTVVLTCRSWC